MLTQQEFRGTPMSDALMDLAQEMEKRQMPPATLNVIGGFAMMLRGYRQAGDITDIDYVGISLYEELNTLSHEIGLKHKMEPGWINNDGMLVGDSMESFELSTGKLHFDPALSVGRININVLDEKDLLRLKIIAADTAMTEMDATGEYARRKDFADIKTLMDTMQMTPDDIRKDFGDYILCHPDTIELVKTIYEKGPEAAAAMIDERTEAFHQNRTTNKTPSPYVENLMDQLMSTFKKVQLSEETLAFTAEKRTDLEQ